MFHYFLFASVANVDTFVTLTILIFFAVHLVGLALKLRISYPIALVIGGCLISFIPGINELHFNPNLVLVIVLPPILFYAAFVIPYKEFQRHFQEIVWLAFGLVFVTTLAAGLLFKWLFPTLPWSLAFAFGAIISPPDAIAATTILKRFSLSTHLRGILEGESLINDAAGLVLFKFAIIALLTGTFSLSGAAVELVKMSIGGAFVGGFASLALHGFSSRFFSPVLAAVYSFTIPYICFFIADWLHFSGVLAVVVSGLIGSYLLATKFRALTRIVGWASWDVVIIILNCFVFMLIGLQLRGIVERLSWEKALQYFGYAILILIAIILVRCVWVGLSEGFKYLRSNLKHKAREQFLRNAAIISWSSMRGIVSLTAALSIPYTMPDGSPLPGRDIVIFIVFAVIFLSLVIPGLSMPWLLRLLRFQYAPMQEKTQYIRDELIKTARKEIDLLFEKGKLEKEEHAFLFAYFNTRHQMLEISSKKVRGNVQKLEKIRLQVLNKKRQKLLELWKKNEISDPLFNAFELELDLEESNLSRAEI